MKYSGLPDATLLIGSWSSSCNNCGSQVLPDHETHDEISGYGPAGRPGCGIRFTHIASEYGPIFDKVSKSMRPDLEWLDLRGLYAKGMKTDVDV